MEVLPHLRNPAEQRDQTLLVHHRATILTSFLGIQLFKHTLLLFHPHRVLDQGFLNLISRVVVQVAASGDALRDVGID